MTNLSLARKPEKSAGARLIVALDVDDPARARDLVDRLRGYQCAFKVGLQLFCSGGPQFVRELCEGGFRVFLDLKFHDIPNTVAKAGVEAARLGVWMFNVHTLGGSEMIRRTVDEVGNFCGRHNAGKPLMIGVTILTSSTDRTLEEVGLGCDVPDEVTRLVNIAEASGLDGVVASPLESALIREQINNLSRFVIVTPGVRPNNGTHDDQKRVMTPGEAISAGSDYLVIGRPITEANDSASAAEAIIREIEQAAQ